MLSFREKIQEEKNGAIKLANSTRVTVTIDSEDLIKDSSQ